MIRRVAWVAAALAALAGLEVPRAAGQALAQATATVEVTAAIDKVFAAWDRPSSPGCAAGVAQRGRLLHLRGYGMANLEYGVPIRPETVFESGSVAKQFTAAAIALLAQDGKLALDDPVRKYVPELPDFGTPILIRHLLNHTSGIRCQWNLLTLAGRPPGTAVHSLGEILGLVSRFRDLNFLPGDEHLYSNTGYTLLAIIVERVSGRSLNAFSQERLFKPLGMTRTQWREDFTAVVENRATAYRRLPSGEFRADMPFTNVVGNGGLLTTAGDLLTWNENFDRPRVGGRAMVDQLQTRGRLKDGSEIEYAQGLYVLDYRGVREVSHGGITAGYDAFLGRFPDDGLSIAVLCNTSDGNAAARAHEVADVLLAGRLKKPPVARMAEVPAGMLERMAGCYLEKSTDAVMRLEWDAGTRRLRTGGKELVPTTDGDLFAIDGSRRLSAGVGWPEDFAPGRLVEKREGAKVRKWDLQRPFRPTPAQLDAFAGDYVSEELGVTYTVSAVDAGLGIRFRPAYLIQVAPAFVDTFEAGGITFRFTRGDDGRVGALLVTMDRARRVRFVKR